MFYICHTSAFWQYFWAPQPIANCLSILSQTMINCLQDVGKKSLERSIWNQIGTNHKAFAHEVWLVYSIIFLRVFTEAQKYGINCHLKNQKVSYRAIWRVCAIIALEHWVLVNLEIHIYIWLSPKVWFIFVSWHFGIFVTKLNLIFLVDKLFLACLVYTAKFFSS